MPSATAREFQRVASRLGFSQSRTTGSHERWNHPGGRAVTIPLHGGREIGPPLKAAEDIITATERICVEHLDEEYAGLSRRLIDKLARKRPSPFVRGEPRVWAGAVLHTVGTVNFLFDKTQRPHMTTDQLAKATRVGASTLSSKSRIIRDRLGIVAVDPRFCRRELLADNPLAWMIEVNGLLMDARTLPPEVQAEARRRGLIPDLP